MPRISLHLLGKVQHIDLAITPLKPEQKLAALEELQSISHLDVEICYFTALMKVLESLEASDIHDELYKEVAKALKDYFYLYRYYKLPAIEAASSQQAGAARQRGPGSELPDFAKLHAEHPPESEPRAYRGLTRLKSTDSYLGEWAKTKEKSIHPASLFTGKALKAQDRVLRYLSYCADPFCSLLGRSEALNRDYAEIKTQVISSYVMSASQDTPNELCYIGFASGLLGRDALSLIELTTLLESSTKELRGLQLIFIDPEYTPLIQKAHHQPLEFADNVKAYLFNKALSELLSLIMPKIKGEISCHLFTNCDEALGFIKSSAQMPKLFIGEDYFAQSGGLFAKDTAESDMRTFRDQLLSHPHPLYSFQAIKHDRRHELSLEAHKPESVALKQTLTDVMKRK